MLLQNPLRMLGSMARKNTSRMLHALGSRTPQSSSRSAHFMHSFSTRTLFSSSSSFSHAVMYSPSKNTSFAMMGRRYRFFSSSSSSSSDHGDRREQDTSMESQVKSSIAGYAKYFKDEFVKQLPFMISFFVITTVAMIVYIEFFKVPEAKAFGLGKTFLKSEFIKAMTDVGGGPETCPLVYLDVEMDGKAVGRIVIKLRNDKAPVTCENFLKLCTGELGFGYKNSPMHRIIPGFMIQGGDITHRNGSGGKSIYGPTFKDENFYFKHAEPFVVSMANRGPNTQSSQFFLTTAPASWLNGKHTVFGKVVQGTEVVKRIEQEAGTRSGTPTRAVRISGAGQLAPTTSENNNNH